LTRRGWNLRFPGNKQRGADVGRRTHPQSRGEGKRFTIKKQSKWRKLQKNRSLPDRNIITLKTSLPAVRKKEDRLKGYYFPESPINQLREYRTEKKVRPHGLAEVFGGEGQAKKRNL